MANDSGYGGAVPIGVFTFPGHNPQMQSIINHRKVVLQLQAVQCGMIGLHT